MKFLPTELNVTDYMQHLSEMLNDGECHVFIDTNILSQLYKLNDRARGEFLEWADSIAQRFHIPNWVVMEYNKRVKSKHLTDYVDELSKIKSIKKELACLQRFLWGYIDNDILQGTEYHENADGLHNELKGFIDSYVKIADVVTKKNADRLKKVEQEIKSRFDRFVLDTNVYDIMSKVEQSGPFRFANKIPPGFCDDDKETNKIGDLIIWQEILDSCNRNDWKKAIFISRDVKDQYFTPERQVQEGNSIRHEEDKIGIAHESLVYEFEKATGSDNFFAIDFTTLVKLLSDQHTELAFSFQMVSREIPVISDEEMDNLISEMLNDCAEILQQPAIPVADQAEEEGNTLEYTEEAMRDSVYLDFCNNREFKTCIERLKSYNWYTQNDAVESLYGLLRNDWQENAENKNAFFVIGRNLLQSADGNAFEAVRFIRGMATTLREKPQFLKKAIVDGCLFEVFFNSNGVIRRKEFKARYFDDVFEQAKELLGNDAFEFINERLSVISDRFVPEVGSDEEYTFRFSFQQSANGLDDYKTLSLAINGQDNSESFIRAFPSIFAHKDDILHSLSIYYAVPENMIRIEGIPDDMTSLRYIREEINDDDLLDQVAEMQQ